jgi:4,5-DOPA dioxygenase extradiol
VGSGIGVDRPWLTGGSVEGMPTLPAAFLGHGSPMNALEHNRWTDAWRALGAQVGRPRAILAVSAHWYVQLTAVTAMEHPRTIHDFYGFPQQLFDVEYPAPGSPEVAREVVEALAPAYCGLDADSWGIDHGAWSLLVHLAPGADVPVLQLSLDAGKSFEEHVALGRALAPLRHEGVLVLASGNVVHNLSLVDWAAAGTGAGWAREFDDQVRQIMTTSPGELIRAATFGAFSLAVPTPEHFLPLAYLAGMAEAEGSTCRTLVEGCDLGSLSMTSYVLD